MIDKRRDGLPLEDPDEETARLRSIARQHARSPEDAEDAVQEVWLDVLRRGTSGFDNLRAVLSTAARRAAWRLQRREHDLKRREKLVLPPSPSSAPPEIVISASARARVKLQLAQLRSPYREVVELRFLKERSYAEIAEQLDRPAETVRCQVHRGLILMRERLERSGEGRLASALPAFLLLALLGKRGARQTLALATLGLGALVVVSTLTLRSGLRADEAPARAPSVASLHDSDEPLPVLTGASEGRGLQPLETVPTPSESAVERESPLRVAVHCSSGRKPLVDHQGVEIWVSIDGEPTRRALTDEDGRASFPAPSRPFWLWAQRDDLGVSRRWRWEPSWHDRPLPIILRGYEPLRGRLLDHLGQPVAGARIVLTNPTPQEFEVNGLQSRAPRPTPTLTLADGSFVLPRSLNHKRLLVEVHAPGGLTLAETYPGTTERLDLRFPHPGRLEARVIDVAGRPLEGCQVTLRREAPVQRRTTTTDARGRFLLDQLSSGTFELSIAAPTAEAHSIWLEVDMEEGQRESLADLVLSAEHTLHGRVVEAGGGPWIVEVESPDGELSYPRLAEDARFHVAGCGPGAHVLRVFGTLGLQPLGQRFDGRPGPHEWELRVDPAARRAGSVRGHLKSRVGSEEQHLHLRGFGGRTLAVPVDADGGFAVEGLVHGSYALTWAPPLAEPEVLTTFELRPGATLDLGSLAPTLPGTLVVLHDPGTGVAVRLSSAKGWITSFTRKPAPGARHLDASFELSGLEPGEVRVAVYLALDGRMFETHTQVVRIEAGRTTRITPVVRPGARRVRLTVESPVPLSADTTLFLTDGAGTRRELLMVTSPRNNPLGADEADERSMPIDLLPGPYSLLVQDRNGLEGRCEFTLEDRKEELRERIRLHATND